MTGKGDDRGRVQWNIMCLIETLGFPGGSDGKESARNSGDLSSIPGLGRSPGEGNGYPLQYSSILSWRAPRTEEQI